MENQPLTTHSMPNHRTGPSAGRSAEFSPNHVLDEFERAGAMLKLLRSSMSKLSVEQALKSEWGRVIQRMIERKAPELVIAVYSDQTGSGTSTLINAVVERDILPASCIHTPIELSYHSKDTYAIEIEFLDRPVWIDCLALLKGVSAGIIVLDPNDYSEASQWVAKIMSFFPREVSRNTFLHELTSQTESIAMLGTTVRTEVQDITRVHLILHRYAAASISGLSGGGCDLWPFVRKAKVLCGSLALASGAVLVDLPAFYTLKYGHIQPIRNYERANHTWITTPIHNSINRFLQGYLNPLFRHGPIKIADAVGTMTFIATHCDTSCTRIGDIDESWNGQLALLNTGRGNCRNALEELERQLTTIGTEQSGVSSSERKRVIQTRHYINEGLINMEREQNTITSLRRSQVVRDWVINSYRQIVQEQAAKGTTVGPSIPDIPFFTCATRDYQRIRSKSVYHYTSDGPHVFRRETDTEIPALQSWCRNLPNGSWRAILAEQFTDVLVVQSSIQKYASDQEGTGANGIRSLLVALTAVEAHIKKMWQHLEQPPVSC